MRPNFPALNLNTFMYGEYIGNDRLTKLNLFVNKRISVDIKMTDIAAKALSNFAAVFVGGLALSLFGLKVVPVLALAALTGLYTAYLASDLSKAKVASKPDGAANSSVPTAQ